MVKQHMHMAIEQFSLMARLSLSIQPIDLAHLVMNPSHITLLRINTCPSMKIIYVM